MQTEATKAIQELFGGCADIELQRQWVQTIDQQNENIATNRDLQLEIAILDRKARWRHIQPVENSNTFLQSVREIAARMLNSSQVDRYKQQLRCNYLITKSKRPDPFSALTPFQRYHERTPTANR